jgi:hypothetical protein
MRFNRFALSGPNGEKLSIKGNSTGKRLPQMIREIPLLRGLNLIQTTFLGVGTAIGGVMFTIMGRAVGAAGPSIAMRTRQLFINFSNCLTHSNNC